MCTRDKLTRDVKRLNTFEPNVENVRITDTFYQKDVELALYADSIELKILEDKLKAMQKTRSQIRSREQSFNKTKIDSFFRSFGRTEREIEMYKDRMRRFDYLNTGMTEEDICGYIIQLEMNKHLNESVMNTEFRLLGPSFLYFDDSNDSIKPFKPTR